MDDELIDGAQVRLKDGRYRTFIITFKPGWSIWSYHHSRDLDNYLRDLSIDKPRKRKPSGVASVEELPIHRLMLSGDWERLKRERIATNV